MCTAHRRGDDCVTDRFGRLGRDTFEGFGSPGCSAALCELGQAHWHAGMLVS